MFFYLFFFFFTSSTPGLTSGHQDELGVVRQSVEVLLRHYRPIGIQTNICANHWQLQQRVTKEGYM